MSKITDLFDFMIECPELSGLWLITAEADRGTRVIFNRGSSSVYNMQNEMIDVLGGYSGLLMPYPSVYEEFQINMYQPADPRDSNTGENNINALSYQETENVCTWLFNQNAPDKITGKRNLPKFGDEKVIAIIPTGTTSTIWGYDENKQIIIYAITARVYYVNTQPKIEVEFNGIEN